MTEYALVGPEDQIKEFSRSVDPKAGTKDGWRWLKVEDIPVTIDPATQTYGEPTITVMITKVKRTQTARAKTVEELDAEKERRLDAVDVLMFKVMFDHENRIRALEGKAGVTSVQFRAALKARL